MENHKLFLHEQTVEVESTEKHETIQRVEINEGTSGGDITERLDKYRPLEQEQRLVPNYDTENFNPNKKKLVTTEKTKTVVKKKKINNPAQEAMLRQKKLEAAADRQLKKEEAAAKRKQRIAEKALRKEERKAEKAHKKEIERLNRMLRPVSRKTFEALGIISFDSKVAAIRKTDDHWIKTYKIEGMNPHNRNEFIDQLVKVLTIRARITSNFHLAETGKLIRTDYLTFFLDAEIYETVKLTLDAEVERINRILPEINIVEISINCLMNQVRRNFLYDGADEDFSVMVKRKNNWKQNAFNDIQVTDDYFSISEKTGACLQVIQYPGTIETDLLSELLKINQPIMFVTDIHPVNQEANDDYKRVIERRFNQRIDEFENSFINVGFTVVVITQTLRQKDEVIDSVEKLFCDKQMVISPVYGNITDVLESSFSYGIKDYHSMRNIPMDQVKKLVV
ncbi:hypothetical protein CSX00_02505 [Pseudobutyrivibrio ruminis]|uniref:Uncharacterized protein n=1 Tax=Pseudobutyrivibrio ruminis TaxID=46206 RepID=A0A2G3ED87_9FIRM|nr:cell envelope integrity protein TolA [Pseudobutyrivibrio ruminis]PHU41204.1 hypothetical protein CSX00_02505 [Pseudobutyrivibrio ruminis]